MTPEPAPERCDRGEPAIGERAAIDRGLIDSGPSAAIDHVNLVVRDLDLMVRFYVAALGLVEIRRVRLSGPWIDEITGLEAVAADAAYLEAARGVGVELICYSSPSADRPLALERPNTPGIRHIAFRVDDIEAVVQRLKAAGVQVASGIREAPGTQVKTGGRKRIAYFEDPEHNLLELCEYETRDGSGTGSSPSESSP
jgi:catechol 2,3-dioxygenase-like lactoylglutathione lyase family enzyme